MGYDFEREKLILEQANLPDYVIQNGDYYLGLHATTQGEPGVVVDGEGIGYMAGEIAGYPSVTGGLVTAAQRSGKGAAFIIPNVARWKDNVLLIDPKGESIEKTWKIREEAFGQRVCVIDPFRCADIPDRLRVRFNPLGEIDPHSPKISRELGVISDGVIRRTEPKDRHWDDGAGKMLKGLIAHCLTLKGKGGVTLPEIREILKTPDEELKGILDAMEMNNEARGLPKIAEKAWRRTGTEGGHFLSSLMNNTDWLDSAEMEAALDGSDFNMSDLKTKKMDLVLVLPPDELEEQASFLRLFVRMALSTMLSDLDGRKCLFLLDEFASLGKIDAIIKLFGQLASHGVMLWPIVQDSGQIPMLYGDHAVTTFRNNSSVQMYFGINDHPTGDYISNAIGKISFADLKIAAPEKRALPASPVRSGYAEHPKLEDTWGYAHLADPMAPPMIGTEGAQPRLANPHRDYWLEREAGAQPMVPQIPQQGNFGDFVFGAIAVAGYHSAQASVARARAELEARERQRHTDHANAKAAADDYERKRQTIYARERAAWERGELQRHTDHANERARLEAAERQRQTRFNNAQQDWKNLDIQLKHEFDVAKARFDDLERAMSREFENRKAAVGHAMHLLDKPRMPTDLVMKLIARGPEDDMARVAIVFTPVGMSAVQLLPYYRDPFYRELMSACDREIAKREKEREETEKRKAEEARQAVQEAEEAAFWERYEMVRREYEAEEAAKARAEEERLDEEAWANFKLPTA